MPIANIIDERKRQYRWRKINAVVEAAWHDNRMDNSDRADSIGGEGEGPAYAEREHISLHEAIAWANGFANWVTLFLYDEDSGIYPII